MKTSPWPLFAAALQLSAQGTWAATAEAKSSPELAIVGGQLIDGYGGTPRENAVILIAGGRIVSIGQVGHLAVPSGAKIIRADGMTILPGMWESHGHLYHIGEGDPGAFPSKFDNRAKEVMAAVAKVSLLAGITTFRDTGGPLETQVALKADIEAGRSPGPRLFLSGPILWQRNPDTPARETSDALHISSVEEARHVTERLIAGGVDQIKVKGSWDPEILQEITRTAHRAGLGVDADVRHIVSYKIAIEAGVDRLHHVFTADPLADFSDEDWRLLVRGIKPSTAGPMTNTFQGPYMIPTVEMRQAYVRVQKFPEMVDHPRFAEQYPRDVYEHLRHSWLNPSSSPRGIGASERLQVVKRKLRRFIDEGGREQLVAGTDAGSPFNVHSPLAREMQHLLEAGLTPMEAIQSATLRPAQMQGVERDLGTVSAGKLADMIVVDGDPLQDISLLQHRLVLVIKGGEVFRVPDRSTF